jgi:hypothetical protein
MTCSRCASPIEAGDLRCSVCALPVPVAATAVDKARSQILRCTECGAAVAYDANKQKPACAFCGAVMKVEEPVDPIEVAQLRMPFIVDRDPATAALRTWLGKRGFFAPKTLRDEAVLESLQPLCWAAWIVNATALVTWTADSNAGAQRSSWAPHAGSLPLTFDNIAIPASRGLKSGECAQLVPHYDLTHVVGVSEAVSGEVPAQIESFDAQRSAARQQVHRAIEAVARVRVQEVLPGTRCRNIHVSCLLQKMTTARIAMPAWVMSYRYRGHPYRAIVHGQRPEVVLGTSPTDWAKVTAVVMSAIAVVLAIVAAIVYFTHR